MVEDVSQVVEFLDNSTEDHLNSLVSQMRTTPKIDTRDYQQAIASIRNSQESLISIKIKKNDILSEKQLRKSLASVETVAYKTKRHIEENDDETENIRLKMLLQEEQKHLEEIEEQWYAQRCQEITLRARLEFLKTIPIQKTLVQDTKSTKFARNTILALLFTKLSFDLIVTFIY